MKTLISLLSALTGIVLISSCSTSTPTPTPAPSSGVDYRNSRADVVVLNFFDMYCHECQKEAPSVNALHSLVRKKGLGSKINFYAIGWGNSPLEAQMYKKRYHPPFPVIPDRNRAISQRFGKFRPPLLIALRKQGGVWKEFYRTHKVMGKTKSVFTSIQP